MLQEKQEKIAILILHFVDYFVYLHQNSEKTT